jgi:cellobiose phosphorylase
VKYSFKHCGKHGLPLLGYADWNDCLNNVGKSAESRWVGQFLCYVTDELSLLARLIGKKKDAFGLKKRYKKMRDTINRCTWDGSWYMRIFDSWGRPVGSRKSREGGRIYLNTQSWAVLSGVADKKRAFTCMDAVKKFLVTGQGIKLLAPAYKTFYPHIGAISTFSAGLKENGGIFCHANPWAVIAETRLRRGDIAFSYYKKTCPAARNEMAGIQKTEPYVYSQFIAGDESPQFGR